MKKQGFTLAEVLITLGIIGVVAAITLPSLMAETQSAQIGPRLAKAVSMLEQGNEAFLSANGVDSLCDSGLLGSYGSELTKYLKVTSADGGYIGKDGVHYKFEIFSGDKAFTNYTAPPHKQRLGNVTVDINGPKSKPNQDGTDVFYFSFWNDGSLRPKGATGWGEGGDDTTHWSSTEKGCPKAENGTVKDYKYCAGHIFENNLKVLYK